MTAALLSVSELNAGVITLQPGAVEGIDTYNSRGGDPDTTLRANHNNGAQAVMVVGQTGNSGQWERSLIKFSKLPTLLRGEFVRRARLGLTVVGAHAGLQSIPVEIYRVSVPWTEGTGSGSESGDGATWQTFDGVTSWPGISGFRTSDGSGFSSLSAETSSPIASGTLFANVANQLNYLELNPSKVSDWLSGTTSNYGMLIRSPGETGGSSQLEIATSDHATSAFHPILEITIETNCVPLNIRVSEVEIYFQSQTGIVYVIERKPDLLTGWLPFTNVVGNGETMRVPVRILPGATQQYFRVLCP